MSARFQNPKGPPKGAAKRSAKASTSSGQPTSPQLPPPTALTDLMGLVIDRDAYYPIQSLITSYLGVDDVRNVQLVCKRTSALYTNMKKSQWNINTSLQPFFKDTRDFRSMQGKTETLIGSEFTGKFLRRLQIKLVLQLFTQKGDNVDAIIEYLKQEGYLLEKDLSEDGYFGFSKISFFTKIGRGTQTSISLWHCIYAPIDAFLKGCMCSAQACFISWNKAYCLFPTATTLKRTSYLMTPMLATEPSLTSAALKRESDEGFIVKSAQWRAGPASKLEPEFELCRAIGDKHSWVMELDTTDVTPATAPDSLLDNARFSVGVSSRLSMVPFLKFEYDVFASCVLEHTYLCLSRHIYTPAARQDGDRQHKYRQKLEHLEVILDAETAMQLTMLEPADRPPQYSDIIHTRGNDCAAKGYFKVPPNWNYFDEEIESELKLMVEELLGPESQSPPE